MYAVIDAVLKNERDRPIAKKIHETFEIVPKASNLVN